MRPDALPTKQNALCPLPPQQPRAGHAKCQPARVRCFNTCCKCCETVDSRWQRMRHAVKPTSAILLAACNTLVHTKATPPGSHLNHNVCVVKIHAAGFRHTMHLLSHQAPSASISIAGPRGLQSTAEHDSRKQPGKCVYVWSHLQHRITRVTDDHTLERVMAQRQVGCAASSGRRSTHEAPSSLVQCNSARGSLTCPHWCCAHRDVETSEGQRTESVAYERG